MKSKLKLKYKIIVILSIFIFLFSKPSIEAISSSDTTSGGDNVYSYFLGDDGTGGKDVKEIDWRFKAFYKKDLDSGISKKNLTKDETYGWYIYEANDEEWVVLRRMHASKTSRISKYRRL